MDYVNINQTNLKRIVDTTDLLKALELITTFSAEAVLAPGELEPKNYPNAAAYYLALKATETPTRRVDLYIDTNGIFVMVKVLKFDLGQFVAQSMVKLAESTFSVAKKEVN